MKLNGLLKLYIAVVVFLIFIGMLLVFSSSGYFAMKASSMYAFFNSHLTKVIIGLTLMVIAAVIPYEYYQDYSKWMLIGTLLILLFTLMFAPKIKGAARWIDIGIIRFQPSELAKLVLIIHLSNLIVRKGEKIKSIKEGLTYSLFWIVLTVSLVIVQPNVSLSIIIIIASFTLLYVGGASFKHLFSITIPSVFVGGTIAMLFHHSRVRILSYINALSTGEAINHQVLQAKIALGSGGFMGVGLGMSRQSDGFVPEAYGDFIFSILGEEFGFVGTIVVLASYLLLFYLGIKMAQKIENRFGQLLVFGLSLLIVLSGFINAAVVMGLLPTTGITLPFISYGGTSLIIFCISVGIIINVVLQAIRKRDLRILEN